MVWKRNSSPISGEVGHRQTGKAQSRCDTVCRRLHRDRRFKRAAGNRSQAVDRSFPRRHGDCDCPRPRRKIVHIDKVSTSWGGISGSTRENCSSSPVRRTCKRSMKSCRKVDQRQSRPRSRRSSFDLLNPMLRGWAQYHRPAVAKADVLTHGVAAVSGGSAHGPNADIPTRSAQWIRRKYWRSVERSQLGICDADVDRKMVAKGYWKLYSLSGTPIATAPQGPRGLSPLRPAMGNVW